MVWRHLLLFATAASATAGAGVAAAQSLGPLEQPPDYARGRNTAVRERPQPGWDPISWRVRAFEVYPEISVTSAYTSNAKKSETAETGEAYWRIRPAARIFSTWSRHGVGLNLWAARELHADFKEDNSTEYNATAVGRLDVRRNLAVDARATHARLVLSRLDPDVPVDTLEPVYYDQDVVTLRAIRTMPRVQIAVAATRQSEDFTETRGASGVYNFDSRDRDYTTYGGRVTYALSPDFAVFGALLREEVDRTSPRLGSLGYETTSFLGGANFDLTNLARGELAIGYLDQQYQTAGAGADSGLALNAEVQWFPSQMTTVSLAGGRRSAPQLDADSPGGITTSASVAIDHELLRNVIVTARSTWFQTDYALIDREDEQARLGLAVTYKLNRRLRVDLGYDFTKHESRGFNARRSFDDQTLSLVLTAYK